MNTTEIIFAIAIAILHPWFFNKLTSQVLGYTEIKQMCKNYKWDTQREELQRCQEIQSNKLESVETYVHIVLLAIAIITIILSSVIQTKSTKVGLGFGGILLLLVAISSYWYRYNETVRVIMRLRQFSKVRF